MKTFLTLSVIVLGISSVMSQLIVMREFLAIFGGNELTVGVILGNWTLLTGIGSYLGKQLPRKLTVLIGSQLGIGILPVLQLSLLRVTKNVLFIQGEIASLTQLFVWSLVLLAPFCLLTGSFFVLACNLYSQRREASDIGRVYTIDSLGDIAGGALFSFVLIYTVDQFEAAYLILFANVVLSLFISLSIRSKLLFVSIGILCIFGVILSFCDINGWTIQQLYRGQNIMYEKNSLYGHIVVSEIKGQITVFENNVPFFSTEDIVSREETVHYAMVQTDEEDLKVLLIGGGASGTIREVLKYPVAAVDYVEIDPDIIEIGRSYTNNLTGASIYEVDGRRYVKETEKIYDVIILDLPDPDSAQLNRFYTVEFFREVKSILEPGGILSLSLSSSPNYLGKPTRELNSSIYKSLKSVFSNTIIIPGGRNFFLASDRDLTYDIAERIEEKHIPTEYVNKFYLSGTLTDDRISMVLESTTENVSLNSDFRPEAYYYYIVFWMSQFRTHFFGFLVILTLLVLFLLLKIGFHPVPFALFTTGFAGTALEVVLVLGFQVLYGYVYSQVGVLITCFLAGLFVGAYYVNEVKKQYSMKSFIALEFLISAGSIGLALFFPNMVKVLFFAAAALVGIVVGAEFPLASHLYYEDVNVTAATLYSADLLGGCLGALLVSTLLVPLLGVVSVCMLVGLLNVLSGLILLKSG